jgi:AhpD family alkylhydroperoxidase
VPRLALIPARRAGPELRRAYRQVNALWGVRGSPPLAIGIMQGLSHRPRFVLAAGEGYRYAGWAGTLPRATRELVALLVSRENACFYCTNAHAAFLQATGVDPARTDRLAEGTLAPEALTEDECILEALVRKSFREPAALAPADLAPLLDRFGTVGTLELVNVLGAFHFINRIADLVDVPSDLPLVQRRWPGLRRLGVRVEALGLRWLVDLRSRPIDVDTAALLAELEALRGEALPPGWVAMAEAPSAVATVHAVMRELPSVDPDLLARVTRAVAAALPANEEESTGFHARPADAIDALAFVGTRYPARTTDALVEAVRTQYGLGDAELTDVFYAIAVRNAVERLDRLLAAPLPTS